MTTIAPLSRRAFLKTTASFLGVAGVSSTAFVASGARLAQIMRHGLGI